MTELVPHQSNTDLTMADQWKFAQSVAGGDNRGQSILPDSYKGNPANVMIAVGLGASMGLSPAESLYRIAVIKGKPSAGAELIAANVRRAGHKLRVRGDDQTCTAQIIRADDPDFPFEVTRDMAWAKQMGLADQPNYRKQPGTMLQWRAITAVARLACPEALYGVSYTPDELREGAAPESAPAPHATAAQFTAPTTSHPDAGPDDTPVVDAITQDRDEAAEAAPSQAQIGRMFALFGEVLTDVPDARTQEGRAARLAYITAVVGREVESSKDLTVTETSAVIDSLQADKNADQMSDDEFAGLAGEPDAQ